jgi:hypothetical protein
MATALSRETLFVFRHTCSVFKKIPLYIKAKSSKAILRNGVQSTAI